MEVSVNFNPQNYYSNITGVENNDLGIAGTKHTVRNKYSKTLRPFNFKITETNGGDIKAITENKMTLMFGSSVNYNIYVSTWLDANGSLWKPNTTIKLYAPDIMVYSEYEFLIKSVSFTQRSTTKIAELTLCLPGSYNSTIPEILPWD